MFTINVHADFKPLVDRLNAVKAAAGDKALVSALNKTVAQAQTQMSRAIREEFNISAAEVRERLRVERANRRSGYRFTAALLGNPEGRRNRSLNVIRFLERSTSLAEAKRRDARGTLEQLHFKIKRRGGKQIIEGAFIANKGRTVFIREGKERLPIKPVQTVGVPQMFNTRRINAPVRRWIATNFPRIFAAEVRYYLMLTR